MVSSSDPFALLALAPKGEDYIREPQLHYSVIRTVQSQAKQRCDYIKDILTSFCSKDPSGIVISYLLVGDKDIELLLKLRQYIQVGNYVRNVMVYIYMLSRAIGGPDFLGYEYLSPTTAVYDPEFKFVSCMERITLYDPNLISPGMIVQILKALFWKEGYTSFTEQMIELEVEISYMRCFSEMSPEGKRDYITCPYCLDAPIKYSYYKAGHQKTKKHMANKAAIPKSGNYYRILLKEGYEEDFIAMAKASAS